MILLFLFQVSWRLTVCFQCKLTYLDLVSNNFILKILFSTSSSPICIMINFWLKCWTLIFSFNCRPDSQVFRTIYPLNDYPFNLPWAFTYCWSKWVLFIKDLLSIYYFALRLLFCFLKKPLIDCVRRLTFSQGDEVLITLVMKLIFVPE